MSTVSALPNIKDEQSDGAVRALRKALEKAEAGELCGVAIAGVMRNGGAYTATSECGQRFLLIGSLFQVAHDLANDE